MSHRTPQESPGFSRGEDVNARATDNGEASATRLLQARLRRHYIKPGQTPAGGVFLTEVQAPRGTSRLDALYVGFTRSRGSFLDGHELKVSRSDWLRELGDATKAEWWFAHTHRWWIVCPSHDIVRSEELPDGWGLMVPATGTTTRMEVVVPAPVREAQVDFPLLLEVTKKLDTTRTEEFRIERAAERERERERDRLQTLDSTNEEIRKRLADADRYEEALLAVQTATGLSLGVGSIQKNWRDLLFCTLEEGTGALREWCAGEVARQRHLKEFMQRLDVVSTTAAHLGDIVDQARSEIVS